MSNTGDSGFASKSIGGTERISNQRAGAGADNVDSYPSQDRADGSCGAGRTSGLSAGYDNNVERSYGDEGEGKKSTMEKIKEKLTPRVKGTPTSDHTTKHAASFGTDQLPGDMVRRMRI